MNWHRTARPRFADIDPDIEGEQDCGEGETPFYLTTETPESETTRSIIATRPKPEASNLKLRVGERVVVSLTSFTVLPIGGPRSDMEVS